MRAVVQRVHRATVRTGEKIVAKIDKGLLVFVGIEKNDDEKDVDYLLKKIINLRIFEAEDGKMNLSLRDVDGELLIVSQFTLCGDCRKGRRPNYMLAASPDVAKKYYELFIKRVKETGIPVQTGVFGAHMDIELINDGPVTLLLDSKKVF